MARFTNFTWDDQGVYIKGLQNTGDKYGIALYRFPHCYELVGREYVIVATEKEYTLKFNCKECAELDGIKCSYEMIKQENGIYFVQLGMNSAVLNLNNGAAALVIGMDIIPGYLKGIGEKTPECAADEMIETKVRWYFGVDRFMEQNFLSKDKLTSTWSSDGITDTEGYKDVLEVVSQENTYKAVKICDAFYLVVSDPAWVKNACCPRGTNKLVLLEDYERCMTSGAVIGKGFDPIVVTGYAKFVD